MKISDLGMQDLWDQALDLEMKPEDLRIEIKPWTGGKFMDPVDYLIKYQDYYGRSSGSNDFNQGIYLAFQDLTRQILVKKAIASVREAVEKIS